MSQLGTQTVNLEYEESGVTVRTSYDITVVERPENPKYTVSKGTLDGAQITNLKARSTTGGEVALNQVEEGFNITFNVTVDSGYTLGDVYYIYNNQKYTISKNIMSGQYRFTMPAGDVTIIVETTPPAAVAALDGLFTLQADEHNIYEFYFNAEAKTGTYTRTRTNSESSEEWSLNFSFSYSAGKITLTLVSFNGSADNTSFASGYRLFKTGEKGSTNTSLSVNSDGDTITLTMYQGSSSSETAEHSFYK